MALSKLYNPINLFSNHKNWLNNIKFDVEDPTNPDKNNIYLVPEEKKKGNDQEKYNICLYDPYDEKGSPLAPGEFIIGPLVGTKVRLRVNHKDNYPDAPVGDNPKYPAIVQGEVFDYSRAQQSLWLGGHVFHEDLKAENDPFERNSLFLDVVDILTQLERWVAACLLFDTRINYSRRENFFESFMEQLTRDQRIDLLLKNVPPGLVLREYQIPDSKKEGLKPPQKKAYPFKAGSEVLIFNHSVFGTRRKMDQAAKPKWMRKRENEELERLRIEEPSWVVKAVESGHYYHPVPVETMVKLPDGTKMVRQIKNKKAIERMDQRGHLFCVRSVLQICVKDYNFSWVPKISSFIYVCPSPIPLAVRKEHYLSMAEAVLDEAEKSGFEFPTLDNLEEDETLMLPAAPSSSRLLLKDKEEEAADPVNDIFQPEAPPSKRSKDAQGQPSPARVEEIQ